MRNSEKMRKGWDGVWQGESGRVEGFTDVPAYLGFKTLMRCIEGWMMGFTERAREKELGKARQSECMSTFDCSAEQKIITDGAPSSRDFPTAAMDGEG